MIEKKLLIVEDDEGLSRGISFAFEQDGYETVTAHSVKEGEKLFQEQHPDAVLLDLNLPDGDGMELCRIIRESSQVPVLMLTARDMEVDEVMGLKSGADDYMTKPFSISVLEARMENILLRCRPAQEKEEVLISGDIRLIPGRMKAFRGEQELDLSLTEFRLLHYFLENKNQILLKEQILQRVWDEGGNFVEENTLPVNISRLRRKIQSGSDTKSPIRTIHGMGYLWEELS